MEMLNELVTKWKEKPQYKDVDAVFLKVPSDDKMVEKCHHGCNLNLMNQKKAVLLGTKCKSIRTIFGKHESVENMVLQGYI